MAELKTKKNDADVNAFLDSITDPKRRDDCRAVVKLMTDVTGEPPTMWGRGMIGFGSYHYKYASGREGDWMATGKSCLYIKKLEDVDTGVLGELIRESFTRASKGTSA